MFRRHFLFLPALLSGRELPVRPVWTGAGVSALGTPSPDGRLLSCVDPVTKDLAVRDLRSGALRRLTRKAPGSSEFAYFSAISPDAERVAYAWRNAEGFYELRVTGIDRSGERVLYKNEEAGFVQPCAWSPDAEQVLTLFFRKDNTSQIALVPAGDGEVRVLRSLTWVYPKRMDFSPDGQYIVYDTFAGMSQGPRDIFVLAADGSSEHRLVEHPSDDLFPLWTRDGSHVVFVSDRSGEPALWAAPVSGGKRHGDIQLLRAGMGRILPLGLTRDGVLIYALRAGKTEARLQPLDGARQGLRIEGALTPPVWSSNGTALAYVSRAGAENFGEESRVIVVRVAATGASRDIPAKLAHAEQLSWSPDGTRLLVSGSDGKGRFGLFDVAVWDGATRPLVVDERAGFRGLRGVWIEGNSIAYIKDGLKRLDLTTGKETVLYSGAVRNVEFGAGMLAFHTGRELLVQRGDEIVFRASMSDVTAFAWSGSKLLIRHGASFQLLNPADGTTREIAVAGYGAGPVTASTAYAAFVSDDARTEIWATDPLFGGNTC